MGLSGKSNMKHFLKNAANLPNALTISRIVAAPVVAALMTAGNRWVDLLAAFLFAVAAFTDLIDGYFARKRNIVTSLGKFLDPLADKVMVCVIMLMLVEFNRIPAWVVMLIICRELMVTGLRAIAADEGVVIAADRFGKIKTILQLLALGPLIINYSWFSIPIVLIGQILLYIALALTVLSGCNYFHSFFRSSGIRREKSESGQTGGINE